MELIKTLNLGLIDYLECLNLQLQLVREIHQTQEPGYLIICSHPPVVTKGLKTSSEDIFDWHGNIVETRRGGRATYHGPSQIIAYPILNLQYPHTKQPRKDVTWLIRSLEQATINTLQEWGLKAHGKTEKENTGVWVGEKKIASIGIAVSHWISYHGLALNVWSDSQAFHGIKPCGYPPSIMTSLEEILGKKPEKTLIESQLINHLQQLLF
ncbi:MAG: lipoyl(octanoyl) transferase LipB [Bdellovibrionaceae bacterium]|nr:lipoyl(octanoyl) transferase LipB [Pseudobdellovibrionaceae bacterium]MDW8189842.1 lipoyl(octanoyl) transferase LipB [Pseudobdellovibrionaceae bacterium]